MKYIKKIRLTGVLLILSMFAVLQIISLYYLNGGVLSFLEASQELNFSQTIKQFNPIKETFKIDTSSTSPSFDYSSSRYRIIAELNSEKVEEKEKHDKKIIPPIASFSGNVPFPNAIVFLEINSEKFFITAKSDNEGIWTWSNLGHPLEKGEHSIEAYNISPYEISGKRDVYAEKYYFEVDEEMQVNLSENIKLEPVYYKEEYGDGDTGDYLKTGDTSGIYLFELGIIQKKVYFPGEEIIINLFFNNLGKDGKGGHIKYEIFGHRDDDLQGEKIVEFDDIVALSEEDSFLKKVKLKDKITDGKYLLKVTAEVDGRKYIQSVDFTVSSKELVNIGGASITTGHLNKVFTWNLLIIFLAILFFLTWIAIELSLSRRACVVDEEYLKKRGYF